MPSLRVSLGCGRIESSVLCRTQAWREGEDAVVAVAAGRSRVSESRTRGEAGAGTGGGIGNDDHFLLRVHTVLALLS